MRGHKAAKPGEHIGAWEKNMRFLRVTRKPPGIDGWKKAMCQNVAGDSAILKSCERGFPKKSLQAREI
jgi:hypothetical protein